MLSYLKAAGIITIAVVLFCIVGAVMTTAAAFGAAMAYALLATVGLVILVGLVWLAIKKLLSRLWRVIAPPKHRPLRQL